MFRRATVLLSFLVIFLLLNVSSQVAGAKPRVVYVAPRTDGIPGTGAESDPYDVSTAAKFDAFFAAQYATHIALGTDPAQFNFAAGDYSTNTGLRPMSGWSLVGDGQSDTTITLTAKINVGNNGYGTAIISNVGALNTVQVEGLTLDGGTLNTGTAVADAFTTPGKNGSVNVSVSSTSLFAVGDLAYVQDTADTGGLQTYYGTYTVTAVKNGRVTLKNNLSSKFVRPGDQMTPPAGATVPTTADVFVMTSSRFGIALAGENILIQDVTVQDVTDPIYEGPVGIDIHSPPGTTGSGNTINRCTVQIIFGCTGWGLSVVYGAPYDGSGHYAQCNITNCNLLGNGYYQGIDLQRVENSSVMNTLISNFSSAIFSDSGPCLNMTMEGNTLVGANAPSGGGLSLAGGKGSRWTNLTFNDNTIDEKNAGDFSIYLLSPIYNSFFEGNHLEGVGQKTIVFQGGGSGNTVSGNTTN